MDMKQLKEQWNTPMALTSISLESVGEPIIDGTCDGGSNLCRVAYLAFTFFFSFLVALSDAIIA